MGHQQHNVARHKSVGSDEPIRKGQAHERSYYHTRIASHDIRKQQYPYYRQKVETLHKNDAHYAQYSKGVEDTAYGCTVLIDTEEEHIEGYRKYGNDAVSDIVEKEERHRHQYKIRARNHSAEDAYQGVYVVQLEHQVACKSEQDHLQPHAVAEHPRQCAYD